MFWFCTNHTEFNVLTIKIPLKKLYCFWIKKREKERSRRSFFYSVQLLFGYAHVNCTFFYFVMLKNRLMDCNFAKFSFDVARINFVCWLWKMHCYNVCYQHNGMVLNMGFFSTTFNAMINLLNRCYIFHWDFVTLTWTARFNVLA